MVPIVLHNPVQTSEGIITEARTEIEVEALPTEIPHQIDIDISGIQHPGDSVRVGDVELPAGVTAITDPGEIIAQMESVYVAPEEVEEEAAPEAETATAEAPAAEAAPEEAEATEE
jgi:large subunit ribosomal protein L25